MKKTGGIAYRVAPPGSLLKRTRLKLPSGSARLEALHADLRYNLDGMARHDSIGSPSTTVGTSRRCAATERPYGPAPMTVTASVRFWRVVIGCALPTLSTTRRGVHGRRRPAVAPVVRARGTRAQSRAARPFSKRPSSG